MTIYVDDRAGSVNLIPYLRALCSTVRVEKGRYDADVEFAGNISTGPAPIGIEYKTLSDCLTSMTDGRLTGTQLPRMRESYPRRYLLIEGPTRVSDDGILETKVFDVKTRRFVWAPARGRKGEGWMASEFWGRLESITEFFGARYDRTYDIRESARWILAKYRYWQKDYDQHSSYQQWDRSREKQQSSSTLANLLVPTSDLPLVQRWAREIDGIGIGKAGYVAQHFKSAAAMVLADEAEWRKIEFLEKLKTKSGYRKTHLSEERAAKIRKEIWEP